jgi:hypothetical protein
LARAVREREPEVIGLNISEMFAFADGLTHNEYRNLASALGETCVSRIKEATRLAVGWLERRIEPELTVYPGIVELGNAIIAEAFSSRASRPPTMWSGGCARRCWIWAYRPGSSSLLISKPEEIPTVPWLFRAGIDGR